MIGWDPSISAGVAIRCNGFESDLNECTFYEPVGHPCSGGSTIISW